jgi:pyruvate kinase
MLESMLVNPEPTRAEASDVANAVNDGTSAVMLSGETSVGAHPVGAVRWMAKLAATAELSLGIAQASGPDTAEEPDGAVMRAAVGLAMQTGAAALVVPTSTGASVRACSKYRPRVPIVAVAHDRRVGRQLALEWGVVPTTIAWPATVDELINAAVEKAATVAALEPGATVVLTAGTRGRRGATNLIVLREVPSRRGHAAVPNAVCSERYATLRAGTEVRAVAEKL